MTRAGLGRRTRFLIGVGSAAVAVAAVLIAWFVVGDEPSETVTAGLGRETVSTVMPTTVKEPTLEQAVTTTSSSESVTSLPTAHNEPVEPCAGDGLAVTTETDRSSYPRGATVTVRTTARNVSDETCSISGSVPTSVDFADSEGKSVITASTASHGGTTLAPDESVAWTTGWNQHGEVGGEVGQVPPGQYSVTVTWGSIARGSASFEILA